MKTLSIRQPWAWLIVNGYKTVENRSRSLGAHNGPLLIHASSTLTNSQWLECREFLASKPALSYLLPLLPAPHRLDLGGIVGMVEVWAKVQNRSDLYNAKSLDGAWYMGETGYFLSLPKVLPFKPCKGRLGFFDVDYERLAA